MIGVVPFRKGGGNIRWDVIERLASAYMVGDTSDPDLEDAQTLSDGEREALKWEMERRDAAVRLFLAERGNT